MNSEYGTPKTTTVFMRDLDEAEAMRDEASPREQELVTDFIHLVANAQMVLAEFAQFLKAVEANGCREPSHGEFARRYQAMYNAGLSDLLDGAPSSMHLDDLVSVVKGEICKCPEPTFADEVLPRHTSHISRCISCWGLVTRK